MVCKCCFEFRYPQSPFHQSMHKLVAVAYYMTSVCDMLYVMLQSYTTVLKSGSCPLDKQQVDNIMCDLSNAYIMLQLYVTVLKIRSCPLAKQQANNAMCVLSCTLNFTDPNDAGSLFSKTTRERGPKRGIKPTLSAYQPMTSFH